MLQGRSEEVRTVSTLAIVLSVVLFVDSLFLIGIVLLQKGKAAGLSGAIGGAAETFWDKNKARSMEGKLELFTKLAAALFIILAFVLYAVM